MPLYPHFQEARKAEALPDKEKVGVCLTCSYWNAPTPRPESQTAQVALCMYPALKEYALLVSGSSACNKWQEKAEAGPEAKAYAERGEEK